MEKVLKILVGLIFTVAIILTCIIMGPVLLIVAAISFIVYVLFPKHEAQ